MPYLTFWHYSIGWRLSHVVPPMRRNLTIRYNKLNERNPVKSRRTAHYKIGQNTILLICNQQVIGSSPIVGLTKKPEHQWKLMFGLFYFLQFQRFKKRFSGHFVPTLRVWAAAQQADFFKFTRSGNFEKIAGVMIPALLAG